MQAYGRVFARVYNLRWAGFARRGLPRILEFYNTVFELQAVRQALLETGWRGVHFARLQDLATPLDDPEQEGRVFIVARK